MKTLILPIVLTLCSLNAHAANVADVLQANIGKVDGSVEEDSRYSCDIDVGKLGDGQFLVQTGIMSNVNFMFYPEEQWEYSNNQLTYFADDEKTEITTFNVDPATLKLRKFYSSSNGTKGSTCVLVN